MKIKVNRNSGVGLNKAGYAGQDGAPPSRFRREVAQQHSTLKAEIHAASFRTTQGTHSYTGSHAHHEIKLLKVLKKIYCYDCESRDKSTNKGHKN